MTYRIKNRINALLFFFILSLLIHSPLLFIAESPRSPKGPDSLVFVTLPADSLQMVTQEYSLNPTLPPARTRFLSKAHQLVEKQTQAMLRGLFQQARSSRMQKSRSPASAPLKAHDSPPALADRSSAEAPLPVNASYSPPALSSNIEDISFSLSMDFLPEIEYGSHTWLNTYAFKHYSYFSRIQKPIYHNWVKHITQELKTLDVNQLALQHKVFSTHIRAVLGEEGEIKDVMVTQSSEEEKLDSAVLYAFLAAAPFPNPPKSLITADGHIYLNYSFHLHLQPPSSLPLRRAFTQRHL